jgi:hypothetical protein
MAQLWADPEASAVKVAPAALCEVRAKTTARNKATDTLPAIKTLLPTVIAVLLDEAEALRSGNPSK